MDKELSINESNKISADLKKSATAADKWQQIGHKLGLSEETIASIGQKYRKKEQCLFATISAWLNRKHVSKSGMSSNVTLRTLVTVLRSKDVDEPNLAKEIEMKGGKHQTKTSYTPRSRVVKPTNIKAVVTRSQEPNQTKSPTLPEPILETYLRGYYSKGSQHQKDEWPPSFNVKYINLMLVKQKKMPPTRIHAEKSIKLITQGDIEHIDGQRLALSDIIISSQRVVLINGAPGVGKTRLAIQLRRNWANKQLLNNFRLVLYIPLRDPIARLSENIDELLNYFEENCNDSDRKQIRKDHGKGALFILDGWDELRPSCREENRFFPKLIRGQTLPECCIIVTSRPGSSIDIASHADQIIEVLGFTQNEVKEYIKAFFSEDEKEALKLIDDLETYPNVASTCYIAINLAIVCYVYHALDMKLPQTLTEVYQWFIIHSVLRHLKRKREIEGIRAEIPLIDELEDFYVKNDFHKMVKETFNMCVKETLQYLGELALLGLQNDDLCFTRKRLVETCKIDEKDFQFDGFGLLKPMQVSLNARSEPHYHFLHLSIQEFIAAYYMSEISTKKWLVHDRKYEAVIKFFCGLDQFKSQSLRIFLKSSSKLSMFHLECTYEGQWLDYCKEIAKRCSNSFKLVGQNLHPRQWEVLGYVIANSETQWYLEYSLSFLGERELKCFGRHLSDNGRALSHLYLDGANIEHKAYGCLAGICQAQVALTKLHLKNCNMKNDELCTIFDALKTHQSLELLQIKDATISVEIIDAFVDLLPTLPALKSLEVSFTCFKNQDYQAIIQCASNYTPALDVITPGDSIFPTMGDLSIGSSSNVTSGKHSKTEAIGRTSMITGALPFSVMEVGSEVVPLASHSPPSTTEIAAHIGLHDKQLDQSCTESNFRDIASLIWKHNIRLPILELSSGPHTTEAVVCEEEIVAGLRKWRMKFGFKANYKLLVESALSLGNAALAEDLCRMLKSESCMYTGGLKKLIEKKHYSSILFQLKNYAADWREIGIHLGFDTSELKIIESRPNLFANAPNSLLSAMLEEWLQWAPGDARGSQDFATLESLKKAVDKVGLGRVAHKLKLQD